MRDQALREGLAISRAVFKGGGGGGGAIAPPPPPCVILPTPSKYRV